MEEKKKWYHFGNIYPTCVDSKFVSFCEFENPDRGSEPQEKTWCPNKKAILKAKCKVWVFGIDRIGILLEIRKT